MTSGDSLAFRAPTVEELFETVGQAAGFATRLSLLDNPASLPVDYGIRNGEAVFRLWWSRLPPPEKAAVMTRYTETAARQLVVDAFRRECGH